MLMYMFFKKKKTPLNPEEKGWISIEFQIPLRKKMNSLDVLQIFINNKTIFDKKNNYIGCINSYLGENMIMHSGSKFKGGLSTGFNCAFVPSPMKKNGGNYVSIKTYETTKKIKKYNLFLWNIDSWGFAYINNYFYKFYGEKDNPAPTLEYIFLKDKPAIRRREVFSVTEFLIEDWLKYCHNKEEIAIELLGNTAEENLMECIFKKRKTAKENKWIVEVSKLLKKYE